MWAKSQKAFLPQPKRLTGENITSGEVKPVKLELNTNQWLILTPSGFGGKSSWVTGTRWKGRCTFSGGKWNTRMQDALWVIFERGWNAINESRSVVLKGHVTFEESSDPFFSELSLLWALCTFFHFLTKYRSKKTGLSLVNKLRKITDKQIDR